MMLRAKKKQKLPGDLAFFPPGEGRKNHIKKDPEGTVVWFKET